MRSSQGLVRLPRPRRTSRLARHKDYDEFVRAHNDRVEAGRASRLVRRGLGRRTSPWLDLNQPAQFSQRALERRSVRERRRGQTIGRVVAREHRDVSVGYRAFEVRPDEVMGLVLVAHHLHRLLELRLRDPVGEGTRVPPVLESSPALADIRRRRKVTSDANDFRFARKWRALAQVLAGVPLKTNECSLRAAVCCRDTRRASAAGTCRPASASR